MERPGSPRAIPDRDRVNMSWLVRLRWAEIAGQASTVLVVQVALGVNLPIAELVAVVGIGLVSNLVLAMWLGGVRPTPHRPARAVSEPQVAAVMALDITLLTALLYLTGGPLNPFGFLYLVQIALATVLVHALWTWSLVALSFGGFGLLLLAHRPLAIPDDARNVGTWVALGVAAAFIVTFLRRISQALAEREDELAQARNLAARQERLAALATMAAGAAHELSTPLGTVALVAKEIERALEKLGQADLVADAKLIRGEVGRCRAILDQMAGGAANAGESLETQTVDALLDQTLTGVRAQPAIRREVAPDVAVARLHLPPRAISQALRSLVTNAQDASPADQPVVVKATTDGDRLRIEIVDRGGGIPADVLARLGEPFFTTKQPGRGMGLGLFLARAVFEGVGGAMVMDSTVGVGTRVIVTVPRAIAAPFAPVRDPRDPERPEVVSTSS